MDAPGRVRRGSAVVHSRGRAACSRERVAIRKWPAAAWRVWGAVTEEDFGDYALLKN